MKEFTAKVRAFSGEKTPSEHQIAVCEDGTVMVWDDVAGHYTTCHIMSPRTMARLRKEATAK